MSRTYEFQQVDVFTDRVFGGNPLAVFTDGEGLSEREMQAIALEMNLSETTFVLPADEPAHAARVRIFTPRAELPFAGHPTIGTAWVLAESGQIPSGHSEATLELGVGPIGVRFERHGSGPGFIWMNQGAPDFGDIVDARQGIADALGIEIDLLAEDLPVQFVSTGLPFLFVPLVSAEAVDKASLSSAGLGSAGSGANGAFIFHSEPGSNRAYSRMIATIGGTVWEDPATGSANGPLGAYMVRHGLTSGDESIDIISEQGTRMGRQSFVHIRVAVEQGAPTAVQVGGSVVPVLSGTLQLPE